MSRGTQALVALGVLVVGLLMGAVVAQQIDQGNDLDEAVADRDVLAEDVEVLRDQLRSLDVQPDVGPPGKPGEAGERGERGERGQRGQRGQRGRPPTAAEVAKAAGDYLRANPPRPGRPPTQGEVLAAVAVFCGDNACDGPAGLNGADGADGVDGADGQPGPPPSDEQVAAQVAAYCDARNQCAGPPGEQGPPGPTGGEGPPPESFSFTWANRTYTCRDDDGDGHYECTEDEPLITDPPEEPTE